MNTAEVMNSCRTALVELGLHEDPGRLAAMERLGEIGFSTRGREDWKYSDMEPLLGGGLSPAAPENIAERGLVLPALRSGHRLVFLDGRFSPELSHLRGLPAGVTLMPLADLAGMRGAARLTAGTDAPFTLLNEAFWRDGALLRLADGLALEEPVELCFMTGARSEGGLAAPRVLIHAGRGSRATVVERFLSVGVGTAAGHHLSAPVGEVFCAPESSLRHIRLLREGGSARHAGSTHVRQAADSEYISHEIAFGGALTRRELHVELAESGARCELWGLGMGRDGQRLDLRTRVEHAVPDCETREVYKTVLADASRAVFDGQITVARDAQRTSAHQTNRNLLLGDGAKAFSIPRLEIYADDVKCSHGSTTGQLEDEQIFYLRSRGIDMATARMTLARAFAGEVLEAIDLDDVRKDLRDEIAGRLAATIAADGGEA